MANSRLPVYQALLMVFPTFSTNSWTEKHARVPAGVFVASALCPHSRINCLFKGGSQWSDLTEPRPLAGSRSESTVGV